MFSAVTSAFIIEVNSQIQPDPNVETAALLRVLIYKIDNTTFGSNVPALPQWSGPPRAIVQAQAILFASLAVSLISALLAMLGKQWLNRYESIERRGSAIERSHSRQRKLDGIIVWYFDYVMESLPLILQVGLLLLGCALSRYLWEVNIIVASVVLSFTSFGLIFYLFIVIAGTASDSCPYQTPGSRFLRYTLHRLCHRLLPTLYSAIAAMPAAITSNLVRLFHTSACCSVTFEWWSDLRRPWYSLRNVGLTILLPIALLTAPIYDAYRLGRVILRSLVAFCRIAYYWLMGRLGTAPLWPVHSPSLRTPDPDCQTIALDLRCISWILRTSLDKSVQLSAFKHLASMQKLVCFHSALVLDCFNIFAGCISISNGKVLITHGLETLAATSADGFFRTLHHLATIDPSSSALVDIQRHYKKVFPSELDFTGLSFHSTMTKIHSLAGRFGNPYDIQWSNPRLSIQEQIPFVRRMAETVQDQQREQRKVPRRVLRSVLYFLSLCPLSPASVIADCLTIVAVDLGCDVSNIAISDERYAQM